MVAIKVLAPELAASPTARKRFLREAQAAAAVIHQHVVTIHAVDEDRVPYLVMECVAASRSKKSSIAKASGAERDPPHRHAGGFGTGGSPCARVIHRDIKPANILLENSVERVKITDFGLARVANDAAMTRTGEVAGTPQYMSPEQAQGQCRRLPQRPVQPGKRAVCHVHGPFAVPAESIVAALRRVCDETPRRSARSIPRFPVWLVDLINRLLAKNPADRFQNATEVVDLLGKHLAHVQDSQSHPWRNATIAFDFSPQPAFFSLTTLDGGGGYALGFSGGSRRTEATGVTKFSATVVRIVTGEGTLVIEVEDLECRSLARRRGTQHQGGGGA